MKLKSVLLALMLSIVALPIWAEPLMQALVPVADHSQAALAKAMPAALKQVLIKVSGNTSVMTLPSIQNASTHITDMISSYRYQMASNPMDPTAAPVLQVAIDFDQQAISQLLSAAGQPVWGQDRPNTLVWLDINTDGQDNVLASTDVTDTPLALALKEDAESRGLGLMFPMNDLTDQANLNNPSDDLLNQQQIQTASKRYGVTSILAGKITEANGTWTAQWLYLLGGAPLTWTDSQTSLQTLADNAINNMAASMISQLAMTSPADASNTIMLQISGVSNLDEYVQVQKYLRAIKQIATVTLTGVDHNGMMLSINYVGSEMALKQAIDNSSQLVPDVNNPGNHNFSAPVLGYHWQGSMS